MNSSSANARTMHELAPESQNPLESTEGGPSDLDEKSSCTMCQGAQLLASVINSMARDMERECIELVMKQWAHDKEMREECAAMMEDLKNSQEKYDSTLKEHIALQEQYSRYCLGLQPMEMSCPCGIAGCSAGVTCCGTNFYDVMTTSKDGRL
ncbi:hypothetical protein COOONC_26738 [Cooperia oncophora]